jgi:aminopeptidase N
MSTAGKDNLTRVEAQERARVIRDVTYDVGLDLREDTSTFTTDTTIRFSCTQAGASTFIDLDAVEIDSVDLNGQRVEAKPTPEGRVHLPALQAENVLRIKADCAYLHTGVGMHRFIDPVDKRVYAYTQFEPFDAHRVFPCFDQPDIKARFVFGIETPEEWVVVSNTKPVSRPDGGAAGRWVFDQSPLMSTYLGALCIGPFHSVFDKMNGIELGWHCRQSLAQYLDPDELFECTKQGFEFFQTVFDYPYMTDSYDQVFCPEYKFGAMENLGCVTYTENFIFRSKVTEAERERRAEVILHEMSHMWFGDLVTMRWWNDLWLNESFATYMAYLAKERATRFKNSWVSFASDEKTWAYRQDQLPTTHPIVADIPDVEATHLNFDGITYAKGASVLKQLVAWVGEDAFFYGLRRYFKQHEYGNTELPDFLGPLAEESGRDLEAWSKEWLETAGVNSIRVEYSTKDGAIESFAVLQEASPSYPTLRSHRMAFGLFDATEDGLELRDALELDVVGERTEVPQLAGEGVPDLVLPNHLDLAYAKVRFDERSLRTLTERLRDLNDPLARTVCWCAAWDMLRDAELPARRFGDLVLNNIDGESDIGVVRDLLMRASSAVSVYGDPANRAAARANVAAAAKERMLRAEPGSDFQLTFARWFIGSARAEDDVAIIRGLLDGSSSVEGLVIDTDLRWQIVSSLTRIGAATDDLIEAELERDPTDQGERYAAQARAGMPTPEAKAEAWEKVTQDPDITLSMMRAVINGFHQTDQEPLLEPYVDRYFAEVLPFWERRELDLGLAFTGGMYPRIYEKRIVRATDDLLSKEVPPPVRRQLIEAKDETERVIRGRAADRIG